MLALYLYTDRVPTYPTGGVTTGFWIALAFVAAMIVICAVVAWMTWRRAEPAEVAPTAEVPPAEERRAA